MSLCRDTAVHDSIHKHDCCYFRQNASVRRGKVQAHEVSKSDQAAGLLGFSFILCSQVLFRILLLLAYTRTTILT
jgi:hypothetical protein